MNALPTALRLVTMIALGAASCLRADAASGTVERTLSNGMRIIVQPDHRAPVVVSLLWYRVGSMDEVNGTTGVAHVLEHMMFKGTREFGAGEFSRIIAAAGGRDNAFTSKDYTGYFQMLHKSQLGLALKLEADRMANLSLTSDEFAKEIKVVMEERRLRTEDRPRALLYERLMAAAFVAHPYRNPVIGWMSDLQNMRAEDAQAFYGQWYAPNNALLVVVGDVAPEEVFALAQEHFGAIPFRALPARRPQDEPPQLGLRRLSVKAPAELPYVLMAFRTPKLADPERDWEPHALEVLANVLSGHPAARLPRALVLTERLANSASASYDGIGRGPAVFYLDGVPAAGRTVEELERALRREVQRIADDGVAEDELNRVKAQAVASHVYRRDSMFFQAQQIGSLEMAGLQHTTLDLQLEKLKQVTPAQVREVARRYFGDDQLTVAYLDPQPVGERRPFSPPAGLRHVQ
jgi:zinc protease